MRKEWQCSIVDWDLTCGIDVLPLFNGEKPRCEVYGGAFDIEQLSRSYARIYEHQYYLNIFVSLGPPPHGIYLCIGKAVMLVALFLFAYVEIFYDVAVFGDDLVHYSVVKQLIEEDLQLFQSREVLSRRVDDLLQVDEF